MVSKAAGLHGEPGMSLREQEAQSWIFVSMNYCDPAR